MTTKVTKESLAAKINRLEGIRASLGDLSISEEYQLEAYRMLREYLEDEHLAILEENSLIGVDRE